MTLEHHHCQPGQDQARFSHAIHHLPIYHRCTIAPSSSKPPLARGHHCTGAPRRPISMCYHLTGSTSTSLTSAGGLARLAALGVHGRTLTAPPPLSSLHRYRHTLRLAGAGRVSFTVLARPPPTFAAARRQRRFVRAAAPAAYRNLPRLPADATTRSLPRANAVARTDGHDADTRSLLAAAHRSSSPSPRLIRTWVRSSARYAALARRRFFASFHHGLARAGTMVVAAASPATAVLAGRRLCQPLAQAAVRQGMGWGRGAAAAAARVSTRVTCAGGYAGERMAV